MEFHYTGPQWNFYRIGWFIKLSVQTFKPLIVIFRKGNFVDHYWRCTSVIAVSLKYIIHLEIFFKAMLNGIFFSDLSQDTKIQFSFLTIFPPSRQFPPFTFFPSRQIPPHFIFIRQLHFIIIPPFTLGLLAPKTNPPCTV